MSKFFPSTIITSGYAMITVITVMFIVATGFNKYSKYKLDYIQIT